MNIRKSLAAVILLVGATVFASAASATVILSNPGRLDKMNSVPAQSTSTTEDLSGTSSGDLELETLGEIEDIAPLTEGSDSRTQIAEPSVVVLFGLGLIALSIGRRGPREA